MISLRCLLCSTYVLLYLTLLVGCPRGDDESGLLGLPCECDDGSEICDTAEICDELSCVVGLCSSECDLILQDCPEDYYCDIVSGSTWCRPTPPCLAEAGLDEESFMMARGEAIGVPCSAPPLGEGSVEGNIFGVSFPLDSQRALFHGLDPDSTFGTMIHVGVGIEVSEVSGQCTTTLGDVALSVVLPCAALRLGTYEVGSPIDESEAISVEVLTRTDEGVASSGSVTLDGYDPTTGAICGSVDVIFNDDEGGRLLGVFGAAALCD